MSRDEFMNIVYKELHSDGDNNRANRIIDAADYYAEENEPHWIPVTERLPETADEVLTTYIVNKDKNRLYVETATYYNGDNGYWSSPWDEYRVAGTRIDVLAWMPLPAPYQPQ